MQVAEDSVHAFEATFMEHYPKVFGVLFRLVGDRQEAEDLALEVFWRLYLRHEVSQDNRVGAWLYRVAVNLGYNSLRARKRRTKYEEAAGKLSLEQTHLPDPDQEAELAGQRELVRKVLAQMKPRSAQLLLLRHSGLTYAEIASALELSPGSIGTLLVRAEQEFEERYRAIERR